MLPYNIQEPLFELVDEVLSEVVPKHHNNLINMGIEIDYLIIDKVMMDNLKISIDDKSFWYLDLIELSDKLLELSYISEVENENIKMKIILNV